MTIKRLEEAQVNGDYWKALENMPRVAETDDDSEVPESRPAPGTGYDEPPSAHQPHTAGTGHASDPAMPVDQYLRSQKF